MAKEERVPYSVFVEELILAVRKYIKRGCFVDKKEVIKNNGVVLDSILIMSGKDEMIPKIYINEYYEEYLLGISVDDIAFKIIGFYYKLKNQNLYKDDITFDYDRAKANIVFRLINYDMNKELLSTIPHDKILDLAVVYYYNLDCDYDSVRAIQITDLFLENWKVRKDDIRREALQNTEKVFPYHLSSMNSIMKTYENPIHTFGEGMFVLTNQWGISGASCILYHEVLDTFMQKQQSDFYILPSSIHEVILITSNRLYDYETLKNIVTDINHSQVPKEDQLSDNAYLYTDIKKEICKFHHLSSTNM